MGLARPHSRSKSGFTLVELLIVVVILAIIAAMAIPSLNAMTADTRQKAFAAELTILVEAAQRYHIRNDEHLPDTSSGVWPTEWDGYIREDQFESGTPLEGVWDFELNSFGVAAAVGAHFNGTAPANADLVAVDQIMDDGDLTTGSLRLIASDRLYYVLEE